MGYSISLRDNKGPVNVAIHYFGSTQVIGGEDRAIATVTYNYGQVYALVGFDMQWLHGRKAKDTVDKLKEAISKLGVKTYDDYWAPTPGNAGAALATLLEWATGNPDAVWFVS